ncbi:MAG TPA: hypothetical protein VHS07_01825 [Candidatus Binataceae bacterium]|nr:hypothetical protein [Candidatus Binataceae bacterium]
MRPPFWEVTLFSSGDSGQPTMIDSIACFSDRDTMRRYVRETRLRFPALQVVVRHLAGPRDSARKNKDKLAAPFRQSRPPAALPSVGQN